MPYQDRNLVCRDCGKGFTWTAGEQEFFAAKGFSHPPSRCKEHRMRHRAQQEGVRGLPQRPEYEIICTNCGKPGKVPFEPTSKHSLLCTDCFMNQRTKVARERVPIDEGARTERFVQASEGTRKNKKEAKQQPSRSSLSRA